MWMKKRSNLILVKLSEARLKRLSIPCLMKKLTGFVMHGGMSELLTGLTAGQAEGKDEAVP
jgi:hypothetical protein